MPYIEWSSEFETGAIDLDGQHKYLVDMLNMAYDAADNADSNEMLDVLDGLTPYVIIHFQTEERLMKESQYPEITEHLREHDVLKSQVNRYRADLLTQGSTTKEEIVKFLIDWLRGHIQNTDLKLVIHLRTTGHITNRPD